MANQWFRLYHEFSTDPKVQMMSESNQRRLVMLMCNRCCNVSETFHDEEVAFQMRISIDEWMATKAVFIEKGFIDSGNKLLNWDKRQYASDVSTARVQKYREKVKRPCNVSETPPDTDTDTDTEKKKKKETPLRGVELPEWVDPKTWDDFAEMRKKIRAPITNGAKSRIISTLEKLRAAGHDPNACLGQSIERSWRGVFEIKGVCVGSEPDYKRKLRAQKGIEEQCN